jgi:hypothetical protein
MAHDGDGHNGEQDADSKKVQDRLLLPLLIPALAFLFGILIVYGLSRIYLELNTYEIEDVTMATPLAIVVALIILFVAVWAAASPRMSQFQIAGIVMLGAMLLTVGGVWAAVHDEGGEEHVDGAPPSGTPGDGPPPGEGILVNLTEDPWSVEFGGPATAPAGEVTFNVQNVGGIPHNLRVIVDGDAAALPLDASGLEVDESAVEIAGETDDIDPGAGEELVVTLEPGPYVLICNIAAHYSNGMVATLTVQ